MRIGWLRDYTLSERPGGAQVCEELLRKRSPQGDEGLELIECPPGSVRDDVEGYVVLSYSLYSLDEIQQISQKRFIHYSMSISDPRTDQGQIIFSKSRKILFASPLHKSVFLKRWGAGAKADLLPYPVNVEKWVKLREKSNGRSGAMWYGQAKPGKGLDIVAEWATRNQVPIDIYGIGVPTETPAPDNMVHLRGQADNSQLEFALATHERFIHFPQQPERFCYPLMESWLAGLEVMYRGRIGLDSWDKPWEDLATDCDKSADTFWEITSQCL